MGNTLQIQITNPKAKGLLKQLEELHLIKIIKEPTTLATKKLSEKYKGILNKKEGKDLNKHIQQMRREWSNI